MQHSNNIYRAIQNDRWRLAPGEDVGIVFGSRSFLELISTGRRVNLDIPFRREGNTLIEQSDLRFSDLVLNIYLFGGSIILLARTWSSMGTSASLEAVAGLKKR